MAKVEYVNDTVIQRVFDDAVLKVVITKCRVVECVFGMALRGLLGSLIQTHPIRHVVPRRLT